MDPGRQQHLGRDHCQLLAHAPARTPRTARGLRYRPPDQGASLIHRPGRRPRDWDQRAAPRRRNGPSVAALIDAGQQHRPVAGERGGDHRAVRRGLPVGWSRQATRSPAVSIDLAAVPSRSALTVSLWIGARPGHDIASDVQRKLFDFTNPPSLKAPEHVHAPAGAFAYPNVSYWIVLSDSRGRSRSSRRHRTLRPGPRGGSHHLGQRADTRRGSNGRWVSPATRDNVLRWLSRAPGGTAASWPPPTPNPGGRPGERLARRRLLFRHGRRAADRYIIHGLSLLADDTRHNASSAPVRPSRRHREHVVQPGLCHCRPHLTGPERLTGPAGIGEWKAPKGATVAGDSSYTFHMDIKSIAGDTPGSTRGGITLGRIYCHSPETTRRRRSTAIRARRT